MDGSSKMFARTSIALLLALALVLPSQVAAEEIDLGGYLKSFLTAGKTFFSETYYLVTHRLRARAVYYPVPELEFRAMIDNQIGWGNYYSTQQYAVVRPFEDRSYVDMTLDPYEGSDMRWRATVHRLYMRYSVERADFTLGRQRIAWGSGRIWNPTDLFNPNSPLSVEPAEKRGADGVRLALRPCGNLSLEAAWAIGADEGDLRWGLRGGTTIGSYDVSLMGGRFRDRDVVGVDFTGYIGDAGFRGEIAHSHEPGCGYLQAVLSYQYTFSGGLDVLAEYLYNGGRIEVFDLEDAEEIATYDSITTLNRHYLALRFSKELHPLIGGSLLGIADIEDGGVFLFPMITYSMAQDLDFTIGGQFFFGDEGDFSLYSHTALVALEWYF